MQKIVPNLWFDGKAKEAAEFYTAVFPDSRMGVTSFYPKTSEEGLADFQLDMAGKPLTVDFVIGGCNFTAINAGPEFTPTPANSFIVNFDPSRDEHAREHLDHVWEWLLEGGEALMPLDEYPFSKRYGWVKDKYGFSWQLMLTNPDGEERPMIIPALMFGSAAQNRAEEAMTYYLSVFENSKQGTMTLYDEQAGPAVPGSVMFADFMLENQWFAAMDAAAHQDFTFNEAVSFLVLCKDQAEIDYFWSKLSAFPENEQCGWCKDKFGVSWQIIPENFEEVMARPGAYATLLNQKKIVIAEYGAAGE